MDAAGSDRGLSLATPLELASALVAAGEPATGHGRTAISFLTIFTPLTPRAMLSAVFFSSELLAKPDNMTVPLSVLTLMAAASTCLFSMKRDLTSVVMPASST